MPNRTSRIQGRIDELEAELAGLEATKTHSQAKRAVLSIVRLLDDSVSRDDVSSIQLINDDQGKIRSNAEWFLEDEVLKDRRAVYKIHGGNDLNIDFKLFGIQKPGKRTIAWAQALTPNFEDEEFNSKYNVGIDLVVPKTLDRVFVVLSSNYIVRTLELRGKLTVTYREILAKWLSITDFDNKRGFHNILWESFDLQPINKQFYAGISEHFVLLRQHLEGKKIMDAKHAAMFSNRLIGRLIFCWFLDRKGVINPAAQYFTASAASDSTNYYREKLETLFYGVLNTPVGQRESGDAITPFLNGGLFEPRASDHFKDDALTFPKGYFASLFEFLNRYNFTTDESTSQFQQVAIDPEMLGRIFENLLAEMTEETGEQARKAKGAFYTPREIVDYMCRESLKQYLKGKIPNDEHRDQRLSQLIDGTEHVFTDQARNWRRDWKPYKTAIIEALDEFTVLDPACGSGAFPMGMMQLLVQVYDRLETRFDSYKTKLGIIKRNIYGIDIEPMAIEISRLRAWLSIVVDEESDSSKIKPLPNLEFKFVCANVLLPLKSEAGVWDKPGLEDQVRELRDEFYSTASQQKKQMLRKRYEKLLDYGQTRILASAKEKQLGTYHPFDGERTAAFFDFDFMFGIKGGFDLVIGNPPYVSLENITEHKEAYKNIYSTASARGDLYCLFYERGLEMTKALTGLLCYITSNKWMRAGYGDKLRGYLASKNPLQLLDFGGFKVFESAAVDTNIILIENDTQSNKLWACHFEDDYRRHRDFTEYCKEKAMVLTGLSSEPWFIGNLAEQSLKKNIEAIGTPLSDCEIKISYGVKTGFNEAFIIDQAQRDELIAADPASTEIIKPILRGRDIRRYGREWAELYVIVAKFGSYKTLPTKYPAIFAHLKKYETQLKARGQCAYARAGRNEEAADFPGQHHWLELDNNPKDEYFQGFENEKIVWPDIMREPRGDSKKNREFPYFYLDRDGYYPEATNFVMTGKDLRLIIAILNSKAGVYFFTKWFAGPKFDNKGFRYKKTYLENFLIPRVTPANSALSEQIETIVDDILAAKAHKADADTSDLEKRIDALVYKLYGLTNEEVALVETEGL